MKDIGGSFYQYAAQILERFHERSAASVDDAARLIVSRIQAGGRFLITGTGHSHMLAEELYARAGGLACITPVLPSEFQLYEHPKKSTEVERLERYADVIMSLYGIGGSDAILIASNSGRNGMIVELARLSREAGAAVVAFTGVESAKDVRSRHSGGLFLKDHADVVIDNCVPPGDAGFIVPGVDATMGAMSTFVGSYMTQLLAVEIANYIADAGQVPPVFKSSNIDGGDEWNDELFRRYLNC